MAPSALQELSLLPGVEFVEADKHALWSMTYKAGHNFVQSAGHSFVQSFKRCALSPCDHRLLSTQLKLVAEAN